MNGGGGNGTQHQWGRETMSNDLMLTIGKRDLINISKFCFLKKNQIHMSLARIKKKTGTC